MKVTPPFHLPPVRLEIRDDDLAVKRFELLNQD
jgi:hypothetical protein